LSPILDWTVAIVRFAMRERRGVDPLIRVVETIVVPVPLLSLGNVWLRSDTYVEEVRVILEWFLTGVLYSCNLVG
jgi:hypothetical protein